MDNPGVYMCCSMILIPLVVGVIVGAWWQRRLYRLGSWRAALVPDQIRAKLEEL